MKAERLLQDRLGTRDRAEQFYKNQVLNHINDRMRDFIGRQEMMFLATSDSRGECDSTLRAGPTGFVTVLDRHRVTWPEYRGNGVMASRGNIAENPHVGLLFVDFVHDVVGLHVNGSANLVEHGELVRKHPELPVDTVPGRRPEHWVVVKVAEAYIHCSKFIPRMSRQPDRPNGKKSDYFVTAIPRQLRWYQRLKISTVQIFRE